MWRTIESMALCFAVLTLLALLAFGTAYATCVDGGCHAYRTLCPVDSQNPELCMGNPQPCSANAPAFCKCRQTSGGCKCCKEP